MTYLLFFYNIAISFASLYLCSTYLRLYRAEGVSTFLYVALLYLLYLIDIIVLYMFDFIPEFEATLTWLQETAPYVYASPSLAMLLCYRLILTSSFDRSRPNQEAAFWMMCLLGTVVSWTIPDFAVSVIAEWVISTVLRLWIVMFGVRMLLARTVRSNRSEAFALAAVLAVFVACEIADSIITFQGVQANVYPIRRIPMEVLGCAYLTAGFLYLRYRRYLERKASEADLIPVVARRYGLTKREEEMLRMLADGMSNRAISEREYISVGTVKTHAHNTYKKLDISGRSELDGFLAQELEKASRPKRPS